MKQLILLISIIEQIFCEQIINVLYLVNSINTASDKAIYTAVNYVHADIRYDLKINVTKVAGNNTQYTKFLEELCSTYETMLDNDNPPDLVVDTTFTGTISEAAKAFTLYMGLPTISSSFAQDGDLINWKNLTPAQKKYLIQISPPSDLLLSLARAIIIEQDFSTAAILTDDLYEIEHRYKSLLQNLPTRHIIAQIDINNPIAQLLHLKKQNIYNLFIFGTIANIQLVLDSADAINMFTKNYAWHAITHEDEKIKCECKRATIIFARPMLNNSTERFKHVTSFTTSSSRSKLRYSFYFDLFLNAFIATEDMHKGENKSSIEYMKCAEFTPNSSIIERNFDLLSSFMNANTDPPIIGKFYVFKNGESTMDFNMTIEVVTFIEGSLYKTKTLGNWRAGYLSLINLTKPGSLKQYRSSIYYRITTRVQHPFVYVDPKAPKKFSGYAIDLIDIIAQELDFDYEISEVADQSFGYMDDDGNWDGLVRELIARRADIALASLAMTADREAVIDFTVPFYESVGHSIVMKVPQPTKSIFRFLIIFKIDAWLSIFAVFCITSLLMWVTFRFSPCGHSFVQTNPSARMREFSFKECVWFCMMSLTSQGGGEAPVNAASRIIAAVWWLFSFIIISSYSANLNAFLTVQRLEAPITKLQDLATQYKISYSTINGSETMKYFQRMANIERLLYNKWIDLSIHDESMTPYERAQLAVWEYPLSDSFTNLWNNMQNNLQNNTEDAVKKVKSSFSVEEGFAFITDTTDAEYLKLTNCDLDVIDEFYQRPLAFALQTGSPLKNSFDKVILELSNKRILESLRVKWWDENPNRARYCEDFDESGSIGIDNIAGVFIFLAAGIFILFLMLFVEYVLNKKFLRR